MKSSHNSNIGMKRLIRRIRSEFETEENINYYSVKDFKIAERKYVKFILEGRADSLNIYPGTEIVSRDQ